MWLKLLFVLFPKRKTFPIVFHVSKKICLLLHSHVSKYDKSKFLTGVCQNTPTSIVIIIFGAKSIGGCVRGRSRVPVTPKPASSDHLQCYRSIVGKFEICLFCGNWKRFNCVEIENLKTSTKLFPRIWKLRAARDVRLIDF